MYPKSHKQPKILSASHSEYEISLKRFTLSFKLPASLSEMHRPLPLHGSAEPGGHCMRSQADPEYGGEHLHLPFSQSPTPAHSSSLDDAVECTSSLASCGMDTHAGAYGHFRIAQLWPVHESKQLQCVVAASHRPLPEQSPGQTVADVAGSTCNCATSTTASTSTAVGAPRPRRCFTGVPS